MYLDSIKAYQFRNLEDQSLQFSPNINLIHGKNGQGKTNLIEAIHILSATKSFRTSKASELSRWGAVETGIHGHIVRSMDTFIDLGAIFLGSKKQYFVDNKETSAVQFVGRLLCVTFSPLDIELVKGAPQLRRQFLDKHSVDLNPGVLQYHLHYNKALKSKQSILKSGNASDDALDAWDRVLADAARGIILARRDFISRLEAILKKTFNQFASRDGEVSIRIKDSYGESVTSQGLFEQMRGGREKDKSTCSVHLGPHRDDFEINLNDKNTRVFASQGQSKSLALALKISALKLLEEIRGEKAVFLLDDVDSELDEERLRKLYEMIEAGDRQVFITGTEAKESFLSSAFDGRVFQVSNGRFS